MAASTSDMAALSIDPTFQSRVKAELAIQCQNVATEAITTAGLMLHVARARFVTQVLPSLGGSSSPSWPLIFAISVSTDANVIADATQNGTVVLTGANAAAQGALVTDTHIGNAISAQFNAFIQPV
jgi:hypothetical protein